MHEGCGGCGEGSIELKRSGGVLRDLVGYQDVTWWGIKRPCGVSRRDHAGATCSVCAAVGTKDITTLTSQVLKGSHDSVRSTHYQGTAM